MVDFAEIAQAWDDIKDTPDVLGDIRIKPNEVGGKSADDVDTRKAYLPDEEAHYKLEQTYAEMFDKTRRAGPQSTLGGLVLPGGRKNFNDFHENFTGTGRMEAKKEPEGLELAPNAPKVDTHQNMAMLYERCVDCGELVNPNDCEVNASPIPPFELLNPEDTAKWKSVGLKPGFWLCYLFCRKCPAQAMEEMKKIKNNAIRSSIPSPHPGPDGKPLSLADVDVLNYLHGRARKVSENVHKMLKIERDNPDSKCFYGQAVATETVLT